MSTGITLLTVLVARNLLHGPMTLLANFVALPADVRNAAECPPVCQQKAADNKPSCMQVALLLPFMRCGELLLGAPKLPLTPVSIKDIFWHHQGEVLRALGHAMLGWAVCFPLMALALTLILQPIFGCLQRR